MVNRAYDGPDSVGVAYDTWSADGVLEHYWGEHIHHGYYPEGRVRGIDFQAAKRDMVDRLLEWAGVAAHRFLAEGLCVDSCSVPLARDRLSPSPSTGVGGLESSEGRPSPPPSEARHAGTDVRRVLDVGCGIGGSTRHLARVLNAEAIGITLSSAQKARAEDLTPSDLMVRYEIADAQALPFEDQAFDLVWSCESGEHMPDKARFLAEMVRVLRPGGTLVLATWCRRPEPLGHREQRRLDLLYREWTLPYFIPIGPSENPSEDDVGPTYLSLALGDPRLSEVRVEDWSRYVSPTWGHQIWEGVRTLPWLLRQGRSVIGRSLRDAWVVWHMIQGYRTQTIRYGLLRATRQVDT